MFFVLQLKKKIKKKLYPYKQDKKKNKKKKVMKVVEIHSPGYYFIFIRRNVSHGDYSD